MSDIIDMVLAFIQGHPALFSIIGTLSFAFAIYRYVNDQGAKKIERAYQLTPHFAQVDKLWEMITVKRIRIKDTIQNAHTAISEIKGRLPTDKKLVKILDQLLVVAEGPKDNILEYYSQREGNSPYAPPLEASALKKQYDKKKHQYIG